MTLTAFAFFTFFGLLFATGTLATAQDLPPAAGDETGCVISDLSCPCALQKSSGTCLRHQGGGACLMGECNDGYKCDCMGFEQCFVSNCSIYTTTNLAVPSESQELSCQLTPAAGKCVMFENFRDTVDASDNAKTTSTVAVTSTTMEMMEVANDQVEMLADKAAVDAVLVQLDVEGAEDVTEEERAEVDNDAVEVTKALADAQVEAVAAQTDMAEALYADLKGAEARRVSRRKEKAAVVVEGEERVERAKPKNKVKCEPCEEMKVRIRALRKERREAAIAAGTWAAKAREAQARRLGRKKNVKKIKLRAREARERCVARSLKILERLSNKPLEG